MPFWFTWDAWVAAEQATTARPIVGDMLPGLPGMIVNTRKAEKISRVPETDITFGTAVLAGSSDAYCRSASGGTGPAYDAAGLNFLGIAMRDMTAAGGTIHSWEGGATQGCDGYRKDSWCVSIVCVGSVWTIAQSAVHEGDPVAILPDGTFMTSNNPDYFIPGARWITSAPAGKLAIVYLNIPHREAAA